MSDRLIARTSLLESAETAKRLIEGHLYPLRKVAQSADDFDHETGQLRSQPPVGHSSVESLVMEVADLAQALGYFAAIIEHEKAKR